MIAFTLFWELAWEEHRRNAYQLHRDIIQIAFSVIAFTLFRRLRLLHDEFIEAYYLIIVDNW